ncbi:protein of unknown function [Oceanospirillum multiglobuliferum]|uniref:Lipase n=1 Tax=Oceanospirillum multiglobuliferum TaxID=64969 RepID=A0A1T4N2I3_9GAMM|nr:DUF4389 domain-containing protein [Oceanospirillum multiglobuliferum]OPX55811.1 hypothetical protein BTE48_06300 [Oceanospirillum multiglobuliferum]SJZ73422.1 protein of unknown function [Oceanospirillum multiglobuliferum]
MSEQEKKTAGIKTEGFWLRIIFMLLFAVAYQIAELLIAISVLLQVIFVALSGEQNLFLRQAGANLSLFTYQVYRYLTFNSEQKPFPFSPWPEGDAPDVDPYQPKPTDSDQH